jgi:methylenetetrahydrofolate dehydrogenase (NADP+) / methenyltetrahydrofolate cyclohydrolase
MIVYGKPLADQILTYLKQTIEENKLHPQLAIILAGPEPASRVYIKYKTKAADSIGLKLTVYEFAESVQDEALQAIQTLNQDPATHGVIVQLPIYKSWPTEELINTVAPEKDVDGFAPCSHFIPATAEGTWEILKEFAKIEKMEISEFLQNKNIVVLGKGKTAGKPIRDLLTKNGFLSILIDSKTPNPNDILKQADLIISATGKKHIIHANNVKDGVYLIGIGVSKDEDGKMVGDIDEEGIASKAKLICPTIGGVGPLTIACLLRNTVKAAQNNI